MRASSIVLSAALHGTLLLLAARAVSSSRAINPPSKVVVEVVSVPHAPLVKPTSPAPVPAPPAPLRHASAHPTSHATPAPEPPAHAKPLATGVELGNEAAHAPAPATEPPRSPSPSPTVQKDLTPRSTHDEESCREPVTKPIPRSKPSLIEYTAKARADGVEGRLLLRVTVSASGEVEDVAVANGVETALDAAAVASVRTWTFAPASRCGKPVSGTYLVARRFELGD